MVRWRRSPSEETHACSTVAGATRWTARPSQSARSWCGPGSPPTCSPSSGWSCRWSRPCAVGSGHLVAGIFLLFPTGLPDLFDGPVAKASGRASVRGAFFDSVADRISDAFLFGGVAWYLAAHHHGEMVLLPFAILAVTSLISYQRAKAELLGLSAKGGLMERAERFILLGPLLHRRGRLGRGLGAGVVGVLRTVSATAVGRFVNVWKEAEGPPPLASTRSCAADADVDVTQRALARWREGAGGFALAGVAGDACPARRHRCACRACPAGPPSRRVGGGPGGRCAVEPIGRIWRARREAGPTGAAVTAPRRVGF